MPRDGTAEDAAAIVLGVLRGGRCRIVLCVGMMAVAVGVVCRALMVGCLMVADARQTVSDRS